MTAAPTFDLQSHSTASDGELEPAAVVAAAARAGVELLALTDHDTVAGVQEALDAGVEHGLRVVPAIELTAVHEGLDLHICGYLVDHRDPRFLGALEGFRADRLRRGALLIDRLEQAGFTVERGELDERIEAGLPVGRPHLASAVLAHPANAARLEREGIDGVGPFIEAHLVEGRPTFVPRTRPSVGEAIDAIHAAGGVAIWAHPFFDVASTDEALAAIDAFAQVGMDGVECFYPTFTAPQTHAVAEHCAARGLLSTGSSDFHGPGRAEFAGFRAFELHGHEPRLGPIGGGDC